jgi:hypothetical protein
LFTFAWLLSFKMLTLKFPIMMIGQCLGNRWIWRLFRNVEIEHEWALYTHTICTDFHECTNCCYIFWISLIIVLKKSKCMCMSYIIINPWPSWIEIYEYLDEFINLYTFVDAWCILISIKHRHETFEDYDHDWCLCNGGVKKLYSRFINYMKIM